MLESQSTGSPFTCTSSLQRNSSLRHLIRSGVMDIIEGMSQSWIDSSITYKMQMICMSIVKTCSIFHQPCTQGNLIPQMDSSILQNDAIDVIGNFLTSASSCALVNKDQRCAYSRFLSMLNHYWLQKRQGLASFFLVCQQEDSFIWPTRAISEKIDHKTSCVCFVSTVDWHWLFGVSYGKFFVWNM